MSPQLDSTEGLQRKRSFPGLAVTGGHDFRKEYKGSALEQKFRPKKCEKGEGFRIQGAWRTISEWLVSRKSAKKANALDTDTSVAYVKLLPTELLFHILRRVDKETALTCRRVCSRWHAVVDHTYQKLEGFGPIELSRLVITGMSRKGVELRWVTYEAQQSGTIMVSHAMIKNRTIFSFNFKRFSIQRIILKDLALTDELVDFLRAQLVHSDLSPLVLLSLHNVDFSPANSLTLHCLLAPIGKLLHIFELTQCYGMKSDSVTDAHMAQLDPAKIRRVTIDGVRFAMSRYKNALRVGDASLKLFAENKNFPTIVLDRCGVTTKTVCDYTEEWFGHAAESEKCLRSQICTVKRCAQVKGAVFEAECRKRGLKCRNRRGSGSLTLYNVQAEHTKTEFTVALAVSLPQESSSPHLKAINEITKSHDVEKET